MTTSSHSSVDSELFQLQRFIDELFPTPDKLIFSVPPEVQQAELHLLRTGRRPEQFFFVVDFIQLTITEAGGLEEMGIDTRTFSFRQYLTMIAPGSMLSLVMLLGKQTFTLSDQAVLSFLKPGFVALLPLTHADGRVLLVKRLISPWQYSESGLITAYLSEFVILKSYENEPLNPRFLYLDPKIEVLFNSMVTRLFAHQPPKVNLLSAGEINLLKLYGETEPMPLTAKGISAETGMAINTVKKHNTNIMQKARLMFGPALMAKTAREVAYYMKRNGLLG